MERTVPPVATTVAAGASADTLQGATSPATTTPTPTPTSNANAKNANPSLIPPVLPQRIAIGPDSFLYEEILPEQLLPDYDWLHTHHHHHHKNNNHKNVFHLVQNEVEWCDMYHKGGPVPRKIAIQGNVQNYCSCCSTKEDAVVTATVKPLYRHPADQQPALQTWTPTVRALRDWVQQQVLLSWSKENEQQAQQQELNHALIQMYRNGDDYISEHADKTLDVAHGSVIVNLSLGATRTLVLRTKREQANGIRTPIPRDATRVMLHHGSLFVLGCKTNQTMTHEIKRDKQHLVVAAPKGQDKTQWLSSSELEYNKCRISITFRSIATFMVEPQQEQSPTLQSPIPMTIPSTIAIATPAVSPSLSVNKTCVLYGQGAKQYKTKQAAIQALFEKQQQLLSIFGGEKEKDDNDQQDEQQQEDENAHDNECNRLIQAFSEENRRVDFDWAKVYGDGFDVVNIEIMS